MLLGVSLYSIILIIITCTTILCDNTDNAYNTCDIYGILIYEDLGCTAEYDNASKCPTKYSCRGLQPTKNHCIFRGRVYQRNEAVNEKLTYPTCDTGCNCRANGNNSQFFCAELDCPEDLGMPVKTGCYRTYSLDACCSVGELCPPFVKNAKCVVEGKTYREGEAFYPKNTCLNCICGKGFKGKFEEPFCERRKCGDQLRYSGTKIQNSCAAFYHIDAKDESIYCCPDDWICPDGSEEILGDATSENTCKFGDKILKGGQTFERRNITDAFGRKFKRVKCECVIPPLVKCTDT